MKIQYCFSKGSNQKYFQKMLSLLEDKHTIIWNPLAEYTENLGDVLVYNTFPNETMGYKFKPWVIEKTDKLFLDFEGPKVLLDSHDNGNQNGFLRFGNLFPRIKCAPTKFYLNNYPVAFIVSINSGEEIYEDEFDREIVINFRCSIFSFSKPKYPHYIRESVKELLFKNFTNDLIVHGRIQREQYLQELRRTKVVIGCPGFGPSSDMYTDVLRTGALLFAHKSLDETKLFPYANLIEGKDYIGYTQFDFVDKLNWILSNGTILNKVRKSGRNKFRIGYNIERSARDFDKYLQSLVR